MRESRWPRGSEWRKWDLHVHTPYSALNNGFGQDFDAYARDLFVKAIECEIAAIGVTDYFTIQGYTELRKLTSDHQRLDALLGPEAASAAREITLFPNVELRSSVLVTHGGDTGRVNYHIIFDPDLEPRDIQEYFLRELRFTAFAVPAGPDEKHALTPSNLKALGARLKEEQPEFAAKPDLEIGMMNAVVDHEDATATLESQASRFAGRYLIVMEPDEDLSKISWTGQGHLTRKVLIQKAHLLFSASPGTREFGLGKRHESVEAFIAEFGKRKACIHGSDAHTREALFKPDLGRQLWIKADPTFQGLRQLLFEPEARAYLGDEPPALSIARERATKYMESIRLGRTPTAGEDAKWFSGHLPLNSGLVAIIGNKGSGKSALSDILGLLGETRNAGHFSFLTSERFLEPRADYGGMYSAEITWHSGQSRVRTLNTPVSSTAAELVKYIPQHFLETICSELRESSDTQFDRELMDVIFSHVGSADRLDKSSLQELIAYRTQETKSFLDQLNLDLHQVNEAILQLEAQETAEYREALESQLNQREADLTAHVEAMPPVKPEPNHDPEQQERSATAKADLDSWVTKIQSLDNEINEAEGSASRAAKAIAAAERLLDRMDNLKRQLESFHAESSGDSQVLGIDTRILVTLSIERQPIDTLRVEANAKNEAAKALLGNSKDGLPYQRKEAVANAEAARERLDEPTRRYEEYRRKLGGWQKRREEIEGSPQTPNSVKGIQTRIDAIKQLPEQLERARARRRDLVAEVFGAKLRLLDTYRALYSPVQEFIDNHQVAQQRSTLQFSASMAVEDFAVSLLNMIHQGRRGSFQGEREGAEIVEQLLAMSDFSTIDGVQTFLSTIDDHLHFDKRKGSGDEGVRLEEQLRQDWSAQDLYDFLYGLGYLNPRFELRWQDKPLDQLSPGERGTLLLIFYLLIDRRDTPLIIDQPEENLDNQTIAHDLIPALRHAKDRRQIIIVTHNPNLAVVCDAEQIIYAHMEKGAANKVTYESGGIEDPLMAKRVVDVLEGTKPAFDIRDEKYDILERLP